MPVFPNADGKYKTKDGLKVIVTRKTIEVILPRDEWINIDETRQSDGNSGGGSGGGNTGSEIEKKMKIIGRGLTGISNALIGE